MKTITAIFKLSGIALILLPALVAAEEMRPDVEFVGALEPEGTSRRAMQEIVFDFAAAWSTCDKNYMERSFSTDVKFSYPTTSVEGLDTMISDLTLFCDQATDTSFYFPSDAFYIDEAAGRVAVEVQFRTFQRGNRQVVNDIWVMTVVDDKATVVKEYLDGRVKDLQAAGILQLEESPTFLTPWPPRTEEWAECFPIVRAAPINECPAK